MTSPQADELRAKLRAAKAQPPAASIEEFRARIEALAAPYAAPLPGTRTTPTDAGGSPAVLVDTPGARTDRVLLYLHGGTYVGGSSTSHGGLASRLSEALACRVLLLDYRRAPEQPFPAAVADAVSAYSWLLRSGTPAPQVLVGGDSAGAALATAVCLAARSAGQAQPGGLYLLSPWSDLDFTGASYTALEATDPWMSGPRLRRSAGLYLAGADPRDPRASPLYADLRGLPPTLVQVGSDEILLDDATRLVDRLRAAGVKTNLHVGQGMWHVWPLFAAALPEGRQAIADAAAWAATLPGWRRKA